MKKILFVVIIFSSILIAQDKTGFQIARLKYDGGGDWYNDPSAEVNLLKFIEKNTTMKVNAEYVFVDVNSDDIFSYPFLFMTGHGNVVFTNSQAERLRKYLTNGGFLYIDDDYGLEKAVRREMKKVFPDEEFIELPFNYGLYNCFYTFLAGVPKIHEHDNKPPQGFGIFLDKRLAVYFTYESNPSDAWADAEVHNDTPAKREEAFKFGTNIIIWALMN